MNRRVLLDTNVLSELMRRQPDAKVLAWFERHPDAVHLISAITRAEILLGVALLPAGKRRDDLPMRRNGCFKRNLPGAACHSMSVQRMNMPPWWLPASALASPSAPKTRRLPP